MPVSVIDSTPGGADANSFTDEVTADQYLLDRLNAAAIWPPADPEDKQRALIEATRELTRLLYKGDRTTTAQRLSWPRFEAENPDLPDSQDGLGAISFYDETIIPDRIQNATAELALEFIRAGGTDIAGNDPTVGIKRTKVDVLETEFFAPNPVTKPIGLNAFPRVMQEIVPLLSEEVTSGSLRLLRA